MNKIEVRADFPQKQTGICVSKLKTDLGFWKYFYIWKNTLVKTTMLWSLKIRNKITKLQKCE